MFGGLEMRRSLTLAAVAALLSACQTSNPADYMQIGPGPVFAYAHARCEIASNGVDRGYFAWGSPSYVAGAALGNALGNAARRDQFTGG